MNIYCASDYDGGVIRGIVCSDFAASDIDDERFCEMSFSDGVRCEVRQRGVSDLATNPTDAFSDSCITSSLERAIQNATEFEVRQPVGGVKGRFLSDESRFEERVQQCRLKMAITLIAEFPTFRHAIQDMRQFEETVADLPGAPTTTRFASFTDDLLAKASGLHIWPGLTVPFSVVVNGNRTYGVVEFVDSVREEVGVDVRLLWIAGRDCIQVGTELFFCSLAGETHRRRLGTVV